MAFLKLSMDLDPTTSSDSLWFGLSKSLKSKIVSFMLLQIKYSARVKCIILCMGQNLREHFTDGNVDNFPCP